MIRLAVVDDHVIVRNGLEQLLATTDDIELVGMASNGLEALDLVAELMPDVVLMDLSMPEMDGVEATRRIVADHPGVRVLVLTSFSDQSRIMEALRAGAEGYLLKHSEPDEIAAAVRAVYEGGSPLDPKAARVLLDFATNLSGLRHPDRSRARGAAARPWRFGQQADRPQVGDQ